MSRAYIALHYNKLKHHTLGLKMVFNVLKQIFLTTQDDIYLLLLHSIRIIYHKKRLEHDRPLIHAGGSRVLPVLGWSPGGGGAGPGPDHVSRQLREHGIPPVQAAVAGGRGVGDGLVLGLRGWN